MKIELPANVPASEFSEPFVSGMANRMAMSFYKYGAVAAGFPSKVDALKCLKLRLIAYEETGNGEHLIDAANYLMIEFMHPRHVRAHFKAEDSAKSPGREWHTGAVTQQANTHAVEAKRNPRRDGD